MTTTARMRSNHRRGPPSDSDDSENKRLREALSNAIVSVNPDVHWDDVAGLVEAKESLKQTVIMPTRFPQRKPFKGILLYGPPGTGKTYLAKAVATEADSTFFSVSSSDLISKWQGESERLVRNLFELARESPVGRAIIFIDNLDFLTRNEGQSDSARRIKSEFRMQMDKVGTNADNVLVLGATNVPWELDTAILQRFEKRVYIPLPEKEARSLMVKLHLGDTPNDLTEADFDRLGEITEGASGRDIKVLVKKALLAPLDHCQQAKHFCPDKDGNLVPCDRYPNCQRCPRKLSSDPPGTDYTCKRCHTVHMELWDVPGDKLRAPNVSYKDFETSLKPSFVTVSPEELQRFTDWTKKFGRDGA